MTPELASAIRSVHKLNSWVRSPSFKERPFGKHAIYWFKRCAVKAAHMAGDCWFRGIKVETKCHTCDGTGLFTHDLGGESRCRRCSGTGTATLEFIESQIALSDEETLVWHSPTGHSSQGRSVPLSIDYYLGSFVPTDWQPNAVGINQTFSNIVDMLNQVETYFTDRPSCFYEDNCSTKFNDFHYTLELGRVSDACAYCGATENFVNYICAHKLISWTTPICHACTDKRDGDRNTEFYKKLSRERFTTLPITPAIRVWQRRHAEFWNREMVKDNYSFPRRETVELLED